MTTKIYSHSHFPTVPTIRKYTRTQEEQYDIIQALLLDIQNQGKYFKK
jgi:hypothetical protein